VSTRLRLAVGAAVSATLLLFASAAGGQKPTPKPEDVAERSNAAYGSRIAIYGIQRNGVIKSNVKLLSPDGVREGVATNKFIRKPKLAEDMLMLNLELGQSRYAIGFDGTKGWILSNDEIQDPPDPGTMDAFRKAHLHSYETFLRFKENEAKLEYAGSKQFSPNNELDLVDLTLPDGTKTRYEISRKTGRIIYLDYDERPINTESKSVKYRLYFKDFRVIQQTLVPFEIQVFRDGVLAEERKLLEVAYNVQLDEAAFKVENARKAGEPNKPSEPNKPEKP